MSSKSENAPDMGRVGTTQSTSPTKYKPGSTEKSRQIGFPTLALPIKLFHTNVSRSFDDPCGRDMGWFGDNTICGVSSFAERFRFLQ